jgi:catalase
MTPSDIPGCPFENIPPEEADQIAETTDLTVKLLDNRYTHQQKKILRGVHPKSHGCIQASFTIKKDLDEDLQIGLFTQPGRTYDAIIRFSNAAALVKPDIDANGDHGSRGMAIKVLDVEGDMILTDSGSNNQDFLMINQPVFAFANTPDYLRLTQIIHKHNDNPEAFFAPLKLQDPAISAEVRQQIENYIAQEKLSDKDIKRILDTFKIVQQIKATGVANPLETQYFSAAPFLFGANLVMKFSALPQPAAKASVIPENPADNYLQAAVTHTLQKNQAVIFDFMVQVRRDRGALDIENASALWDEDDYPFIKVASVTIPAPQAEITSKENRKHCENLAYTPWHCLAAHQPIGSINRLRKPVYQASAEHRLYVPHVELPVFIQIIQKILNSIFGR